MIEMVHASAYDIADSEWSEFDAQITDPPYSPHVHKNAASHRSGGVGSVSRDLGFEPLSNALRASLLVGASMVRGWSVFFSDLESIGVWKADAAGVRGLEYIRTVPWIRWSQPQLSGDRPPTGGEAVMHFLPEAVATADTLEESYDLASPAIMHFHPKGAKAWNGPGSLTHYYRRCLRASKKDPKHPTEKPLDLMLDMVSWFTQPGQSVIDPCAGSGTTILACQLLGRSGVGVELDEGHCARAQKRLTGGLSARDAARAVEWCDTTEADARRVPAPKSPEQRKTWERAQRRIEDAARVRASIKMKGTL